MNTVFVTSTCGDGETRIKGEVSFRVSSGVPNTFYRAESRGRTFYGKTDSMGNATLLQVDDEERNEALGMDDRSKA